MFCYTHHAHESLMTTGCRKYNVHVQCLMYSMLFKLLHVILSRASNQIFFLQDTCTGFLLGGIGELNKKREPNFLVVNKSKYFRNLIYF